MTDEPTRLEVIEGGANQRPSRKPVRIRKPSGKEIVSRPHVCPHCDVSALIRARLGGQDVSGKLRGGAEWWCCVQCWRPFYFIRYCT